MAAGGDSDRSGAGVRRLCGLSVLAIVVVVLVGSVGARANASEPFSVGPGSDVRAAPAEHLSAGAPACAGLPASRQVPRQARGE